MKVAIIKYNAGNIVSVVNALHRLGIEATHTDDPDELKSADKVIFPGQGEASNAMNYLRRTGIDRVIPDLTQPFLGICLGLQLLCAHSEENNTECLGLIPCRVKKFPPKDKIPHMGWNLPIHTKGPLFHGLNEKAYMYFVHSYYAELCPQTTAQTDYIVPFSSAIQYQNYHAVQFHPEKSGKAGEELLSNFLKL